MTCPCSRSRYRSIRRLCSLVCLLVGCCSLPQVTPTANATPQDLDKPLQNIDEDITAFAIAPDGRIVYSVRHIFRSKKFETQRDDVWLQETGGKRRRILDGQKFIRGNTPFTYTIEFFRWSPNGKIIAVQLFTSSFVDESGPSQDMTMTLFLDDSGREIHPGKGDSAVKDAENATWLKDNSTVVYFNEEQKPRALFSFQYLNLSTGPAGKAFEGRTFIAADAIRGTNGAIAVERNKDFSGPPRLQRLELLAQEDKELATLDSYETGLSVSPSGKRVAYFIDKEVLEIRDVDSPSRLVRLRIGLGPYQWSAAENQILLKRAVERKSGDIVWIDIPELTVPAKDVEIPVFQPTPRPILHDLTYRDFAISPDGRLLAVVPPGKHNLLVFPVPH
jgi:dipeptidyl aminopeptidase/acylaminoacyl peptidase